MVVLDNVRNVTCTVTMHVITSKLKNSKLRNLDFTYVNALLSHVRQDGVHTVPPENFEIVDRSATVSFDLGAQSDLTAGEKYIVRVIAVNGIGESEPSNDQDFTRVQGQWIRNIPMPSFISLSLSIASLYLSLSFSSLLCFTFDYLSLSHTHILCHPLYHFQEQLVLT